MIDVIVDDLEIDELRLLALKNPGQDFTPISNSEELYLICYRAFVESINLEESEELLRFHSLLFDAQVESKKQFDPSLSQAEIDTIIRNKGGYSTLSLRALIDVPMSEKEQTALFELGAYIQYCNDIQDLHKDLLKGINSFASKRIESNRIQMDLEKQRSLTMGLLKDLPFAQKQKDDLLFTLHVMHAGILAKLKVYMQLCGSKLSKEDLLSKDKAFVRAQMQPLKLMRHIVPEIFQYRYKTVGQLKSS